MFLVTFSKIVFLILFLQEKTFDWFHKPGRALSSSQAFGTLTKTKAHSFTKYFFPFQSIIFLNRNAKKTIGKQKKKTFSNFRIGFLLKKIKQKREGKKTFFQFSAERPVNSLLDEKSKRKKCFLRIVCSSMKGKPLKKQNVFFFCCQLHLKRNFPRPPTKIQSKSKNILCFIFPFPKNKQKITA